MNRVLRSCTDSRWCKVMLFTGLWNLGARLHPDVVADGWYASDCDPGFKPSLPFGAWLRWRVACVLRGTW